MTAEAKHIIDDFGALPDPAKREVLRELLRMSRYLDYPEATDEELLSSADEIFREYDRQESGE